MKSQRNIPIKPIVERQERIKTQIAVGSPEVGVWWLLPSGNLLVNSMPVREGEGFVDGQKTESAQSRYWEGLRKDIPEIRDREFTDFPRGYIDFAKENQKYYVFTRNEYFVEYPDLKEKILSEFRVPLEDVIFKQG
ncbi:hypothetical protein A9Q83_04190 [Alphaproteobacteria bacterium 46_93_T64]|nr:hypothetical protein A9Q83_04190 [Alphaproteobacteria bacterium 46_93_T64]